MSAFIVRHRIGEAEDFYVVDAVDIDEALEAVSFHVNNGGSSPYDERLAAAPIGRHVIASDPTSLNNLLERHSRR